MPWKEDGRGQSWSPTGSHREARKCVKTEKGELTAPHWQWGGVTHIKSRGALAAWQPGVARLPLEGGRWAVRPTGLGLSREPLLPSRAARECPRTEPLPISSGAPGFAHHPFPEPCAQHQPSTGLGLPSCHPHHQCHACPSHPVKCTDQRRVSQRSESTTSTPGAEHLPCHTHLVALGSPGTLWRREGRVSMCSSHGATGSQAGREDSERPCWGHTASPSPRAGEASRGRPYSPSPRGSLFLPTQQTEEERGVTGVLG